MSRQRDVGSRFAREVAEYLDGTLGPGIERRVDGGTLDRGDVTAPPGTGLAGWVVEVKREKTLNLAGALGEAAVEAVNAKVRWHVAVAYRRRSPGHPGGVAGSYAAMPLWVFREVLAEMRRLRAHVEELERKLG